MRRTQRSRRLEANLRALPDCGRVSVSGGLCAGCPTLCVRLDEAGTSSLLRRNYAAFARALAEAAAESLGLSYHAPRAPQPCTVCRSAALRQYPRDTARAYGALQAGCYVSALNVRGAWAIVSTDAAIGFFPADALQFL